MSDDALDFGAYLRLAREQKGLSLREIAAATKISVLSLEALERNDASRLPGGIFSRAFVRAYAREVDLDPDDAVRRFVARFPEASMEETPQAYEPNPERILVDEPATSGRLWRAFLWSIPLLLVVAYFGIFGGRVSFWSAPQTPADPLTQGAVPAPPKPAEAPAPAVAGDTQPAAATAAPGQALGEVPAPTPPPREDGAAAAASPAAPAASPAPPAASEPGTFRLLLAPRDKCWVSVRANGTSLFSGLMQGAERKELDVHGTVSLTVGNAGAFSYAINGRPGRVLGGTGEVVTVVLNVDNLSTFIESR